MSETWTLKFKFHCSRFDRVHMRITLRTVAQKYNLTIVEMEDEFALLSGIIFGKVEGSEGDINKFIAWIKEFNRLNQT